MNEYSTVMFECFSVTDTGYLISYSRNLFSQSIFIVLPITISHKMPI